MSKKSNQIKTELDATAKRLSELNEMQKGITGNLETLQQGFIDGKTSLDELQTEQGKLTTLNSSIKALESKQNELHDAFQKASASETRQALLEKAKETAIEAATFHHEFIEIRNKFHDSIRDYAEKTVEKMLAWRGRQKDFERIANETGLTFKELEQLGLTAESYRIATANHINPTPLEYGVALNTAINFLTTKLDESARAKKRAEFDRERFANQEKIKVQIEAENNKPKPLVVTYDQQ
jgi:acyl carrier protein phosphodiesterase